MKKLIFITLMMCLWTFTSMAQVATNKIVNTAVIYSANSPLTLKGILNAESNVFIGGVLEAGTNASSVLIGAHFLVNRNPGNPVLVLRNHDVNGLSGFYSKDSAGNDSAFIGFENNTSNLFIRNFMNKRVQIDVLGGSNILYIQQTVTTNTMAFVSGSVNSTNYMVNGVRGMTLSVTNVGIGETNVEVFAQGLLTNKFTIP